MSPGFLLYVVLVLLDLLLAVTLARYIGRFWRVLPWLIPLVLYFTARVVRRAVDIAGGHTREGVFDVSMEVLQAVVLVALILSADRMIRGFQTMRELARYRAEEYDRAVRDYTQVVRHRIANPLTVIIGSAESLEFGHLTDDVRSELLTNIRNAASEIARVSLGPDRGGEEERGLDPRPRLVDGDDAGTDR